jgi:hypothetical protein
MTGSSTELPFPNCENSASAELVKKHYPATFGHLSLNKSGDLQPENRRYFFID